MRHAESGQVMIIFALFIFVLIGFVAISIDAGFLMAERRQVQNAADAAALAAAKSLYDGNTGQVTTSGQAYGSQNADVPAGNVLVSWPPASGEYAGDDEYVQVSITKEVEKFFVGAVYTGDWEVAASAVAGVELMPANYALITLEEDDEPGIKLNGNTGIIITGNEAGAMSNTNITAVGVASFSTTGTLDAHTGIQPAGGTWTPANRRHPNIPQIADPIGWMSPPAKVGSPMSLPNCNSGCTVDPGWYRNTSMTVRNTATFRPGIYYFENVDIDLQNTNSKVVGDEVLFYFDEDSTFDPKNGDVDISTKSSGWGTNTIQNGLVFWYAACNTLDMQGNGTLEFKGIFYAPCAHTWIHGTPGVDTIDGQLIVGTLDVRGNSAMRIAYHGWVDTERPKVFLVQ